MSAIPMIRLEVEGMKYAIQMAMSEHLIKMDKDIQAAVDAFCTPEKITAIVFDTAAREIKSAIESEVRHFYAFGAGRRAIADSVRKQLGDENE